MDNYPTKQNGEVSPYIKVCEKAIDKRFFRNYIPAANTPSAQVTPSVNRKAKCGVKYILAIIIAVLLISMIIAGVVISAVALTRKNTEDPKPARIAHDNLYSDSGYVNYAEQVYFDVETYPDMAEMGLFWTEWDNVNEKMVLKDADSAEGAALVDPNKPTLILVHGMLADGYYSQEGFFLNKNIAIPSQFGLETNGVPLALIWQNLGWNVGYFHYNRFGAEGAMPHYIEGKIWATDGESGIRYRHRDNTTTDNATEYSVAEHFAAEYIRAMNLLPDTMGNKEIRVAAHSMGGEVSTAGLFLLTVLADEGQLNADKLPHRFTMMDPYFSTSIVNQNTGEVLFELSPKDITIRWSGKTLPYNHVGWTMIDCIKTLDAKGIAIEYYAFDLSFLVLAMPFNLVDELKKHCVYVIMQPDYGKMNPVYSKLTDGHNGVRDWYLCSIYTPPVVDEEGNMAASASTPTETIKALKGKYFVMSGGSGTVLADDDIFSLQ